MNEVSDLRVRFQTVIGHLRSVGEWLAKQALHASTFFISWQQSTGRFWVSEGSSWRSISKGV